MNDREPDDEASGARLHSPRRERVHPAPEALQALADGAPDALEDADLASHVVGCPGCRTEVDEARRVAARLSAFATPPDNLLARVQARRAAGERVLLPAVFVSDGSVGGLAAHDRHPSAESLDQYADQGYADQWNADQDGDAGYDRSVAAHVAAHVAACATCAAVVDRTRRVTGALSLGSAPPDDLLARVRARRAAGADVSLPPVQAHPGEEAHAAVADAPRARPVHVRRRGRRAVPAPVRWSLASLGAVAALLLVTVRYGPGPSGPMLRPDDPAPPGAPHPGAGVVAPPSRPTAATTAATVARSSDAERPPAASRRVQPSAPDRLRSAPVVDEPAPSAPDSVPGASTSQAPDHSAGPLVQMRVTPGELSVVLAGGPRDDFAPVQAQALDSVARVLGTDPGRRAAVRYTDPAFTHDSPSWEAARRVSDYLMLRGVAGERVALVRVALVRAAFAPASGGRAAGGRAATDAVEVVVPSRAGRE